jgi:Cullin family
MISYIKMPCGPQFTKNLMLAAEEQKKYDAFRKETGHDALASALNRDIDFNVTILTTSYWSTYKTFAIKIPLEVDCKQKHFNAYYTQKYNHRQLQWCYSMGNATVGGKFPIKDCDLVVGTYQLCSSCSSTTGRSTPTTRSKTL